MSAFIAPLIRLAFVAVALDLWFWTQRLISGKPMPTGAIGDRIHELTAPLNRYLMLNPQRANLTLILTSGLIDAFGIFLFGETIFGATVRPFVALVLVMALRQVCQSFSSLPAPEGLIWRHPGFPSLLVTYGVSNDFFFSGHTAIAVLGALEIAHLGHPVLTAAAGVVAAMEAFTVLVLRAHYWMDVFAALFAAFVCEAAAGHLAPFFDGVLGRPH